MTAPNPILHPIPPTDGTRQRTGLAFMLDFYIRHRSVGRAVLAGVAALLLADTAVMLLFAFALKQALGVLTAAVPAHFVWSIALQFLALLLAKLLVDAALARLLADAVSSSTHALRLRLFAQLQALPGARFRNPNFGPDTAGLFAGNTQTLGDYLTYTAPKIAQNLLLGVFSVAAMASLDWRLTAICLAAIVVTLPLPRVFSQRHKRILDKARGQEAAALGIVDEALVMHSAIRAFNLAQPWLDRFAQAHAKVARTLRRVIGVQRMYEGTMINAANFLVFVLIVSAMALSTGSAIPIAVIGAFFVLLQYVAGVLTRLGALLVRTTPAEHAARSIDTFLQLPVPQLAQGASAAAVHFDTGLSFDAVSFAYAPGQLVLDNVTFGVRPGEFVALVGPSGSGKSSVLALLMREHAPQQGRIQVDTRDVAELPQSAYTQLMSIIAQDTRLFNVSVRENIRAGRLAATDAEVEDAALAAEAHTMVLALPQGYDTPVLEYGANLSGGQRQRIAIARALVARPRLLLVDEATSALDIETEAAINDSLARISLGCTVIQVTHRLRSVARASRILVMEGGRIVESGTHAQLLALGGSYARLLEKQQAVDFDGHHRPRVDISLLRKLRLFANVGDAALQEMARSLMVERVPEDTTLFTEGSEGDKFYIVARGKLEVRRGGTTLAFLDDGDCFGEMALLMDAPRNGTVLTRTDCVLLTLDRQQFRAIVGGDAALQAQLDALVAQRSAAPQSVQ